MNSAIGNEYGLTINDIKTKMKNASKGNYDNQRKIDDKKRLWNTNLRYVNTLDRSE